MDEAEVVRTEDGTEPRGAGWYVLNAQDASWWHDQTWGADVSFEGDVRFEDFGFHIGVLEPGTPACHYHREGNQEGFLILRGECLLIVEGQERTLRAWDYFHCPAGTEHVLVAAGDEPCVAIAVGGRHSRETVYPVNELAGRHGASVSEETTEPAKAYEGLPPPVRGPAPRLPRP